MTRKYFSTAITALLTSALVASGSGVATPGGADAAIDMSTQASTATSGSARQESTSSEIPYPIINTETNEQLDLVNWALGRFELAGLDLPPLTINTHSERADCNGLNGYLAHAASGEYIIHACGVDFTLLHELAHAWDMHSLSDETRDEFLREAAHATTWTNTDSWLLAGGEHAANVIAWALMGERINQTRTRPYDHNSMLAGFKILTGGTPLWMDI